MVIFWLKKFFIVIVLFFIDPVGQWAVSSSEGLQGRVSRNGEPIPSPVPSIGSNASASSQQTNGNPPVSSSNIGNSDKKSLKPQQLAARIVSPNINGTCKVFSFKCSSQYSVSIL